MNKIAAIVVTYNRLPLLEECVKALLAQTEQCFDILIIDNASTDGTGKQMQYYVQRGCIQYFNTGRNSGGAGGFNFGIRKAYELGYEYYWLMDDDTIPTPGALSELLIAKDVLNNDFGFLYSYAKWIDGSACRMNLPGKYRDLNKADSVIGDGIERINRATFVSFFISRGIVEKVGLPIKEFFIWADDTNYCIRIRDIAPGYWVKKSIVVHKMARNSDPNIVYDDSARLERYVYCFRNRFLNARIEHSLWDYFVHVCKRAYRIILSAKDQKWKRLMYMFKGVWQGFFFMPDVEYVQHSE